MNNLIKTTVNKTPWNKGKIIGQKPALKLKELWAIRIRLQMANNIRRTQDQLADKIQFS